MSIGLTNYIILSSALFVIGAIGVLIRRNVLIILLSIEIMINGGLLGLLSFSYYLNSMDGQVFALFVMALAAAEAAVALAVVLVVYRRRGTISSDEIDLIK